MKIITQVLDELGLVADPSSADLKNITSIMGHPTVPAGDQAIMNLLQLDKYNGIIAGGAALCWWGKQCVGEHDIDIWLTSEKDLMIAISTLDKIGTNTITTKNAKTYLVNAGSVEYTVQLIHKILPSVEELFKEFDITVCRIATNGSLWWIGEQFAQDYKTKTLRMVNLRKNSLRRFMKYVNYGYQPEPQLWQSLIDHPDVNWDYATLESYEDYADAF